MSTIKNLSALEAINSAYAPILRLTQQWQKQNETIARSLLVHQQNLAVVSAVLENPGFRSTMDRFTELSKAVESSAIYDVTRSLARLHTSLEVGTHIDLMIGQNAGWQTPLATDLAGIAGAQVSLAGWAARAFPDRALLTRSAKPLDRWRGQVLDLPETLLVYWPER